jgi:hypothetical protein
MLCKLSGVVLFDELPTAAKCCGLYGLAGSYVGGASGISGWSILNPCSLLGVAGRLEGVMVGIMVKDILSILVLLNATGK